MDKYSIRVFNTTNTAYIEIIVILFIWPPFMTVTTKQSEWRTPCICTFSLHKVHNMNTWAGALYAHSHISSLELSIGFQLNSTLNLSTEFNLDSYIYVRYTPYFTRNSKGNLINLLREFFCSEHLYIRVKRNIVRSFSQYVEYLRNTSKINDSQVCE
jgi:hypothetical protein